MIKQMKDRRCVLVCTCLYERSTRTAARCLALFSRFISRSSCVCVNARERGVDGSPGDVYVYVCST